MVRALTDAVHMTVGPDVTEDGVTYGELLVVTDAGMLPGTTTPSMNLTCRYEKKTFLMHDCKTDIFTERFTGYDDPANVIVLPADAAAAVDGGPVPLPLPLPSAHPPLHQPPLQTKETHMTSTASMPRTTTRKISTAPSRSTRP